MIDAMVPLFLALVLGHYAGDYLLQTHAQALGKLDRGLVGLRHAVKHAITLSAAQATWILIFSLLGAPVNPLSGLIALTFNAVTHVLIDWGRRGPDWWCRATGSEEFYDHSQPEEKRLTHTHGAERVDQALHYQVLGVAALLGATL